MIKISILVSEENVEMSCEGMSSKKELLLLFGSLEDLKFKLLSNTQDDGSEFFVAKKDEVSK